MLNISRLLSASVIALAALCMSLGGGAAESRAAEASLGRGHCPTPHISYRYTGHHRRNCCSHQPQMTVLLSVKSPEKCNACPVEVPVCVPACCVDVPCVSARRTLIGCGQVTYEWRCGVSVTVRFQRDGDLLVTYHGV